MRPISIVDHEARLEISSPSEITCELVRDLFEKAEKVRILWPRQSLNPEYLQSMAGRYFIQIGMTANPIFVQDGPSRFEAVTKDNDQSREMVARTFDIGFGDVWAETIGQDRVKRFRNPLIELASSKTARFVEFQGRPVGAAVVCPFPQYTGEMKDHFCWVWVDQTLPKGVRKQVIVTLLGAAKELAPGEIFCKVFVGNTKSLAFSEKAGFQSIWATFSK